MASGIIAEQVEIRGKDETGPAFASAEAKVKAFEKTLQQLGKAANLGDRLKQINDQLAAIDKLQGAEQRLGRLNARYAETKAIADRLGAAYAAAEKPTAAMQRAMEAAANTARRSGGAYYSQLEKVEALQRGLERAGVSVNRLAAEENRLHRDIDATTAAMTRQVHAEKQRADRRQAWQTLGGIAGAGAAHEAARFARQSFLTYRQFDMERRWGKAVMGLTDEEQEPLVKQAIHGGATTKFNDIKFLETQRELGGRGLTKEQVLGTTPRAAIMAQALGGEMAEAARMIEGALFGFHRYKPGASAEETAAAATHTADLQVRAAKLSGMGREDLTQLYKYGATPAYLAGISEENLLTFGALAKRSNIGGDEAGTAFRALMKNVISPTREAREAMLARGMNFKNYQRNPSRLEVDPFVQNIAAQYGVRLSPHTQAGLARIFSDKGLIEDPAKFTPAVMGFLRGALSGRDAKSLKSIAGAANRYRNLSMNGVDANKLLADLIPRLGDLQFANSMFGSKQGGRIAAAFGDPETRRMVLELLQAHADGYSDKISEERMKGFDGAVSRFEGAVKNMETAIGRSWDKPEQGSPATWLVDRAARLAQSLTELDSRAVQAGSGIAALAAGFVGFKSLKLLMSGFGLKGSAVALTEAARELKLAARTPRGGAPGPVPGANAAPVAAAVGPVSGALMAGGAIGAIGAGLYTGWVAATKAAAEGVDSVPLDPLGNPIINPFDDSSSAAVARRFGLTDEEFTRRRLAIPKLEDTLAYRAAVPMVSPATAQIIADRNAESGELRPGGALTRTRSDTFGESRGAGPGTRSILADRDFDDRMQPGGALTRTRSDTFGEADLGSRIRTALEGLKATMDGPVIADVTGKLDPVELKGEAQVRISVKVDGGGKVTDTHTSSSGHIRTSVGTSSPDAKIGAAGLPW